MPLGTICITYLKCGKLYWLLTLCANIGCLKVSREWAGCLWWVSLHFRFQLTSLCNYENNFGYLFFFFCWFGLGEFGYFYMRDFLKFESEHYLFLFAHAQDVVFEVGFEYIIDFVEACQIFAGIFIRSSFWFGTFVAADKASLIIPVALFHISLM